MGDPQGDDSRRPPDGEEDSLVRRLHRAVRRAAADVAPEREGAGAEASGDAQTVRLATDGDGGALHPGSRVGDFRLVRFVARGGMGQVWEAEDQCLRRRVALKLVLPERVNDRSLALFTREARAGGRLAHPNLVTTLAHGSDRGLAWIAQEFIDGSCTLRDVLDRLRAEPHVPRSHYRQVAGLVAALADGLQAAHKAGVVHRDVKPQNVLMAPDDTPKLTDFGLARITDDSFLSRTGDFAGTYAYMSPEQLTAKRMGLDHRTDVFSLGVVLYELLTLRRPFEGDTTHQIAQQIIAHDPVEPTRLRSQCPRDLAVIAGKALEKSPDRRYQSMAEFAADLRRHLEHEPVLARPPGPWARATKWAWRHPARASSLAVALAALAVVSGLLVRNVQVNRELSRTVYELGRANTALGEQTRRAVDSEARGLEQLYVSSVQGVRAALEGEDHAVARQLLERAPEPLRGWEWGHLDLLADQAALVIAEPGYDVEDGAWSPDGTLLAVALNPHFKLAELSPTRSSLPATPGRVRIVEVPSGRVIADLDGHTDSITALAFSPDGVRLVSLDQTGEARLWELSSRRTIQTLTRIRDESSLHWAPDHSLAAEPGAGRRPVLPGTQPSLPAWLDDQGLDAKAVTPSPSGDHLAAQHRLSNVGIWEVATGTLTATLRGHDGPPAGRRWSPNGGWLLTWFGEGRVWIAGACPASPRWHEPQGSGSGRFFRGDMAHTWKPDGSRVAVADTGGRVVILDATNGQPLRAYDIGLDRVAALAWSATGDRIAAVGDGNGSRLVIVDPTTGEQRQAVDRLGLPEGLPGRPSHAASWSPDGSRLAVGLYDGRVALLEDGRDPLAWSLETWGGNPCLFAAWSPDGARLVCAGLMGPLLVLDARDGTRLQELRPRDVTLGSSVGAAAWDPAGRWLAIGVREGDQTVLEILDTQTWEVVRSLPIGADRFVGVTAWSPDGRRIASASPVSPIRVWNPASGELLFTLRSRLPSTANAPTVGVSSLAWSPDGARLSWTSISDGFFVAESRRPQALRLWQAADARRRLEPMVDALLAEHGHLDAVRAALVEHPDLDAAQRQTALSLTLLHPEGPVGDTQDDHGLPPRR